MKYLVAAMLFLVGCGHPGELYVVLDSDLDPKGYSKLAVVLTDTEGKRYENTYDLAKDAHLPASMSLRADRDRDVTIDAKLYAADGQTLLVERKAEVPIVHGQSLELTLRLDATCAYVSCTNADETCVDGACVNDAIGADMLGHTSGSVGGPHDGGIVPDLSSVVVADMASRGLDFASADLSLCPPVPPAPTAMPGCTLSDFTTHAYEAEQSKMTIPSGATLDQHCPALHIHLDQGSHTITAGQDQLFRFTPASGAVSTPWRMQIGYWMTTDGRAFTGIIADDRSGHWFQAGTTEAGSTGGDKAYGRDQTDPFPGGDDTGIDGGITVNMSQTPGPQVSFFATVGTTPENESVAPGFGTSSEPSFFVGNETDPSSNDSNQIDVYLGWVMYCPNGP